MRSEKPFARIRPPACAGRFYPADPGALREMVSTCLQHAKQTMGPVPKAVIAPHAGYAYSGSIAGSVYQTWRHIGSRAQRVILIGPAHYMEFQGVALSAAEAFDTPLGAVRVDEYSNRLLESFEDVKVLDAAHAREHALEVQLPFLQSIFDDFSIVPLLVGVVDDVQLLKVLEAVWGGEETRVVVSSDLSHYHDYLTALAVDSATAKVITELDLDKIESHHACGFRPVRALLAMARRHALTPAVLDLRNSGDTAGPRDRVVGYGAFSFAATTTSAVGPEAELA